MVPNTNDGSQNPPRLRIDLNLGVLHDLPPWSKAPCGECPEMYSHARSAGYDGFQGGDAAACRAAGLGATAMGRVNKPGEAYEIACNLRDAGLRKLIACPSLQRITSLNLCNNNFTLNGVIAFFKCGSLEKLEELYLGFSPITVELVHEFLNSPRLPALKLLNLHGCPAIDADQQRAFKRKYKTRVSFQYRR